MAMSDKFWTAVTPSQYPHEKEALEYIRAFLPDHEPFRAWSNFEFIADDGSINEVDLLVLTSVGFFLVEIKHWAGEIAGDQQVWKITRDGRTRTVDNPRLLANRKAKKLKSLLEQHVKSTSLKLPFLDALVFISHEDAVLHLEGPARAFVCLRDRESPRRLGIRAALLEREVPGIPLEAATKRIDKPLAKLVTTAFRGAGIRRAQQTRRLGNFVVKELVEEGPEDRFQDFVVEHTSVKGDFRRARLYHVTRLPSAEERESSRRAAEREYKLLGQLDHPGILRVTSLDEHDRGPLLFFDHLPKAQRLDHFIAARDAKLGIGQRLELIRGVAEALRYAHEKRVVHRGLAPQSVLVVDPDAERLQVKLFNWQLGLRRSGRTGEPSSVTATRHVTNFVDNAALAYLAPEVLLGDADAAGFGADVYSLGALAYFVMSGRPPAQSTQELIQTVRELEGLRLSAVIDGAPEYLEEAILQATHPQHGLRWEAVRDFLDALDLVECDLAQPKETTVDPRDARKGDMLEGGFEVDRRIGQGSTAIALLVERDQRRSVLKVASTVEQNLRLRGESEVLQRLRHTNIVALQGVHEIHKLTALELQYAGDQTLADVLREDGRLSFDMLRRFGTQLLEILSYLEHEGVVHRDIKPDNLGIAERGKDNRRTLILFDFSLARAPSDDITSGTRHYLEPFLHERKPPRWDQHAERWAAAVTLHEMATGDYPRWGDGKTDPLLLKCEATIEPEAFDPELREGLAEFFRRAFRRNPAERFDNAEAMLAAWRQVFDRAEAGSAATVDASGAIPQRVEKPSASTPIVALGFSTRATNALDRAGLLTVGELLDYPLGRIASMRGVGQKTRREILDRVSALKQVVDFAGGPGRPTRRDDEPEPEYASLDQIGERLVPASKKKGDLAPGIIRTFLRLQDTLQGSGALYWPSQTDVAAQLATDGARVSQALTASRNRWRRDPRLRAVRDLIDERIDVDGGAASLEELASFLIASSSPPGEGGSKTRLGGAIVRAAIEAELAGVEPRFVQRRRQGKIIVAKSEELAGWAMAIGKVADELAASDPLPSPSAVLSRLRDVKIPPDAPPPTDARLVGLAAAASQSAAASPRLEIYPRGLEPARALRLAQGALVGQGPFSVAEIRKRVTSRYPEAAPLPDHPELADLLREAGLDLRWDPQAAGGTGGYGPPEAATISSTRLTSHTAVTRPPVAPDHDAITRREFERRVREVCTTREFLVLLCKPRDLALAEMKLSRGFDLPRLSLESAFLNAMQDLAREVGARWEVVLSADAAPRDSRDWSNLTLLAARAANRVAESLTTANTPILLTRPGLLARYSQMSVLDSIREQRATFLLLAQRDPNAPPVIGVSPVPVISSTQWRRVPDAWLHGDPRASKPAAGGER